MTTSHPRGIRRARPCGGGHPIGVSPAIVRAESPKAWVRVTCPACGVVRVRSDRVVIRNCLDDQSWSYRARCSGCDTTFVGATPSVLALPAVAAGIVVELWSLPQPSARHAGATLHAVDALELHLALLEPDWFDELLAVEPLDEH
jgi:hypothetical protein